LIDVEVTCCEVLFNGCIADIVTAFDVTGHVPVPSPDRGIHGLMRREVLNCDVESYFHRLVVRAERTTAMHWREPFASPICSTLHILWKRKQ
jgi:hypothetical protein